MTPELLAATDAGAPFFKWRDDSFPEHFCYEENDDGSADASSEEEIHNGVTDSGEQGMYYQCNHGSFLVSVCFALQPSRDGCRAMANGRSRPFVSGVVDGFLAGIESGDEVRFLVLNVFLRVLDGILRLVLELLPFPGKQLPRCFAGLGCIKQRDTGADKGADGEGGEATS